MHVKPVSPMLTAHGASDYSDARQRMAACQARGAAVTIELRHSVSVSAILSRPAHGGGISRRTRSCVVRAVRFSMRCSGEETQKSCNHAPEIIHAEPVDGSETQPRMLATVEGRPIRKNQPKQDLLPLLFAAAAMPMSMLSALSQRPGEMGREK